MRPEPPTELSRLSLIAAIFRTAIDAQIDVQAAQIAFNAVFALGPLMALTMTLLSALPVHTLSTRFHDLVVPYAPPAVRPFLEAQLRGIARSPSTVLVALSVIGLLWTISASTSAIATALAHVGWPHSTNWARRRLRAAVLGVVAALGLVLSALAAAIGPVVLDIVSRLTGVAFSNLASFVWLRWPIAGAAFGLATALFVTFGTQERPRPMAIAWGGVTAGVISVVATSLLAVYLAHAPRLGGAYGAAGAVFAALLWLYVLALGLLVGATVTFVLHTRGPHFAPIITGARHVATHALAKDEPALGDGAGRLLRRQHLRGHSAAAVKSRIARPQPARRIETSSAKRNGVRRAAPAANGREVELERGLHASEQAHDARDASFEPDSPRRRNGN